MPEYYSDFTLEIQSDELASLHDYYEFMIGWNEEDEYEER